MVCFSEKQAAGTVNVMISFELLLIFIVTTFIVVITPGPAAIAVTAEAASNGFKRSTLVILGIAIANVVYFALSAAGIAALILASSTLFSIIKWVGVAYLIYLGASAIFGAAGPLSAAGDKPKKVRSLSRTFLKGFIIEIANPKALLYFSALLPQFIDVSLPVGPQLLLLCLITFCLDVFCYSLYGVLGHKSAKLGARPSVVKLINRTAGGMLIFAGLKMATVN